MKESLLKVLRMPETGEELKLYKFESQPIDGEEDIIKGLLVGKESGRAYPIIDGVPVMMEGVFPTELIPKHEDNISVEKVREAMDLASQWSFSSQWDEHFDRNLTRTWGWSVEERVKQFLLETETDPETCKGKLVLDAGCGNGELAAGLTTLGATVVGIDYSNSVFPANKRKRTSHVQFVQGDLQSPPFAHDSFDIIVSNGVLHHTPDTYKTFVEVSRLVKPGGRFYLFLYRRPENFVRRYLVYPMFDLYRAIVSRLPKRPQALAVQAYAMILLIYHRITRKRVDITWDERVISAYDSASPRWRHYHTPLEVSSWFFENGFSPAIITHWDNRWGFGMLAYRVPEKDTPGENFGRPQVEKRYWK